MKILTKAGLSFLAILFGFTFNIGYAASNDANSNSDVGVYDTINGKADLSYMPRIYLDGAGGYSSGSLYLGEAKLLQPVLLRYDRNLFIYGEGRFSNATEDWFNSPWSGSLGVGYRQILDQSVVLGGYVLGGYTKTPTDHGILFVNPGFEALGKVWEFRLNGYFPVSKSKWETQGWADNFGNNNYVIYQGHDEYDAWFTYNETAGMGADTQIGRKLFKIKNVLVKGFLEGYYFSEGGNNAVKGGGATVTAQPYSYLKVSLSDTYDNYAHNVAMFGVEISLYDLFTNRSKAVTSQDLQHRLFEPIEHNFAAIGSGNVIPTAGGPGRGNPDVTQYGPPRLYNLVNNMLPVYPISGDIPIYSFWNGHNIPERTNVWFFNGSNASLTGGELGDIANGTYENPFSGSRLTQDELSQIYANTLQNGDFANAYLYFTQGTYNAYSSQDGVYSPLEIYKGESIWGRTGDHKGFGEPAIGDSRPVFIGGLQLDSKTSLNDMMLQNSNITNFAQGIIIDGATGVGINDSQIGVDGDANKSYATGIKIVDASSLIISGSDIYGYSEVKNGVGIEVDNGSQTNITATDGSKIEGHSTNHDGIGIYVAKDAQGNAELGNLSGGDLLYYDGKYGAQIIGKSDNTGANFAGYGLYASSNNNEQGSDLVETKIGNISNLEFDGISSTGSAYGLYATSQATAGKSKTTVGNISYAKFYAGSDFNSKPASNKGIGLYAAAFDTAAAYEGDAETDIGNITHGNFYGYGTLDSFGLSATSSSTQDASKVSISTIQYSKFLGQSSTGKASGFDVSATAKANSSVEIKDILSSDFEGYGVMQSYGFDVTAGSPMWLYGSGDIKIGNIRNDTFWGQAANDAVGFYVSGVGRESYVWINSIEGSHFTGYSYGASGDITAYGLHVEAQNIGPVATPAYVKIGNLEDSTFTAQVTSTENNTTNAISFLAGASTLDNPQTHIEIDQFQGDSFIAKNYNGTKAIDKATAIDMQYPSVGYIYINGTTIRGQWPDVAYKVYRLMKNMNFDLGDAQSYYYVCTKWSCYAPKK